MPVLEITGSVSVGTKGLMHWFSDPLNQSLDAFESSLGEAENDWLNPE